MSDERLEIIMDLVRRGYKETHKEKNPGESDSFLYAEIAGASKAIFDLLMTALRLKGDVDV